MANDIKQGELMPVNKGGRPSKYRPEMVTELVELMQKGRTNIHICAKWGVSEDTFYRWLKEKPELKEAFDNALPQCQVYWENMCEAAMLGQIKGFKANMFLAFMSRKFKNWADTKPEVVGTHINIESMQVLQNVQNMDDAELEAKIKASLKNFEAFGGPINDELE